MKEAQDWVLTLPEGWSYRDAGCAARATPRRSLQHRVPYSDFILAVSNVVSHPSYSYGKILGIFGKHIPASPPPSSLHAIIPSLGVLSLPLGPEILITIQEACQCSPVSHNECKSCTGLTLFQTSEESAKHICLHWVPIRVSWDNCKEQKYANTTWILMDTYMLAWWKPKSNTTSRDWTLQEDWWF